MLKFDELDQHIENFMQEKHVPGLALAIVQGEEVIYAQGYGKRSIEDNAPVTPETLFRIGSTTKPMTGMAIMRLVEEGKIDLDRPIKTYFTALKLSDETASEQVTLRMLLSHTAGLPTRYQPFGRREPGALEDRVREELPEMPLVAPPGKVFSYSNPGIDLAGYIAERVSGKYYSELMAEYVFQPLDMQRTTFDPLIAMTYPIAQSHIRPDGKTLQVEHRYADNTGHYPSGYAISTVLDLANFANIYLQDGQFRGRQILGSESVKLMCKPHTRLYTPSQAGYGITLRSEMYKGTRLVSHDGDVNSFNSRFLLVPDAKIAIILLSNRPAELGKLSLHILDEVLALPEQETEPEKIEPERASWSRYTGWYLGQRGLAKIMQENDHLLLDMNGKTSSLEAYSHDIFGSKNKKIVGFVPEEEGPIQYIVIDGLFSYKRIDEKLFSEPDPSLWTAFEGVYTAIFDTYSVRIHKGQLKIKSHAFGYEGPCKPLDRTRFTCEGNLIEFRDIEKGKARLLIERDSYPFTRVVEK